MPESIGQEVEDALKAAEGKTAESAADALKKRAENLRAMQEQERAKLGEALVPRDVQIGEMEEAADAFAAVGNVRFDVIEEGNVGGYAHVGREGSAVVDLRKGVRADGTVDERFLRGVAAHERRHEEQVLGASDDILETDAMLAAEKKVPGSINDVSTEYRTIVARTLARYTERQVEDMAMGRATEADYAVAV